MRRDARLELRIRTEAKALVARAAELEHITVSDFVRSAAEERAERVISAHAARTRVPADLDDDPLLPPGSAVQPDQAPRRKAARARVSLAW